MNSVRPAYFSVLFILSLLSALFCQQAGAYDLTGFWQDDAGGRYQIRQTGNTVVWYDERKPAVMNVFTGTIAGDRLDGRWYDLPGGELMNSGAISLRIESNDRLVKIGSDVFYLGNIITRDGSGPGGGCDLTGRWRHYLQGIGQSVFTFTPLGGGRYSMREEGLGNATGTVVVNGNRARMDWTSVQSNDAGYIEWTMTTCSLGEGTLFYTYGKSGTIADRIERLGLPPDGGGGGICADPRTLGIMDEWLARAIPPQGPEDRLRYESWGRLTGETRTATIRPAGPPETSLTRCEYLWQQAAALRSTNGLGTLQEYVLQRLR